MTLKGVASFTRFDYVVADSLDSKYIKGIGRLYLARVKCAPWRWVIGRGFKNPGDKIPKGTPYYYDFGDALKAFDRQ